jgi:dTDP-4-dehydrorhamnose reductase
MLLIRRAFENQRRWLARDLLCGMVDIAHPNVQAFAGLGHPGRRDRLVCATTPARHKSSASTITSHQRPLSRRGLSRYPSAYWGGNAHEAYAIVDAVRVLEPPGTSRRRVILEAARRYAIPLALTEVHIGCTEE